MYTIIGKIDNFNRRKSYKGFEVKKATVEPKVNKCIVTKVARKKHSVNPELVQAKAEFRASANAKRKPQLLVSTKLN